MKTIITNLYGYNELSNKAKKVAINMFIEDNEYYDALLNRFKVYNKNKIIKSFIKDKTMFYSDGMGL